MSGRVVDQSGAPLTDVRITTTDRSGARHDAAAVKTDARGAFSVATLANGTYTLRAVDDEHAPAQILLSVAGKPVNNVTFVMNAGGVVYGTVFDAAHVPVPFASVHFVDGDQSRDALTDGQGAFEVSGLGRHVLRASAESATAMSRVVDVDLAAQTRVGIWLLLDVAGQISGTVVDEGGAPFAGAQVTAWPAPDRELPHGQPKSAAPRFAASDRAGRFIVYGLSGDLYQLSASKRANVAGIGEPGLGSIQARSGDKNVRVVVAADGTLTGRVVLEGSSVAPKLVTVAVSSRVPTPAADGGAFRVSELAPGTYDVMFRSPDFADLIRRNVEITSGTTTDLGTVSAVRGRTLAGKVVDAAGEPVANAQIKVGFAGSAPTSGDRAAAFEAFHGIRFGVTDPEGEFVIAGLPPVRMDVIASHPERGTSDPVAVLGDPKVRSDPPRATLTLAVPGATQRQ